MGLNKRPAHTHDKRHAMARMFNWCKLAKLVLQAEFPDFELLAQFSVFRMLGEADEGNVQDTRGEDCDINVLANLSNPVATLCGCGSVNEKRMSSSPKNLRP